ncbi:MAG: glycosyltransferase [Methanomicrobiales archaeon]|nr:glycosyltransferase [Methanomicrobiales archaeon]
MDPGASDQLTSIILPTYNEAESILRMIDDIFYYVPPPVEIIVVDDDSPDRTWDVAGKKGDPRVKIIRRVGTRGLASATVRGILEARGDVIGILDAEMPMVPPLLPGMIGELASHDVVVASRYVDGGRDERPWFRVITSRLLNRMAQLLLGHGVLDYDSGIFVMRRSVLDKVLPSPAGYGEYFIEFIYACRVKGMNVSEVPCVYSDRIVGTSKSDMSIPHFLHLGVRYGMKIITTRLKKID